MDLILPFLERNFINIIVLICLVILMLRGADKVFPKLKKAKISPVGGIEVERDCGEIEERRDCSEKRGRRSTDVCSAHCSIAEVIASNTKALEELKNTDNKLVEHEEELWVDILQLQFYSTYLPKQTRMIAGLRYLWWGLNSDVSIDMKKFIDENLEIYKSIIVGRPELKLGNYAKGHNPEEI